MNARLARLAVAALPLLLLAGEAFARVGGGHGYSGGGGGGGGGGFSGGGGGDGGGDLAFFLIWLIIRHPAIGVPVALVVVGVLIVKSRGGGGGARRSYVSHRPAPPSAPRPAGTESVRQVDPNFSEVLFIDFAQLLFARAHELRPRADLEPLRPWFTQEAVQALTSDGQGLVEVKDVIFGSTRIARVAVQPRWTAITVLFEANLTEVRVGASTPVHLQQAWTFHRKPGVLSPGPERMRALGCASCGDTGEPRADGTCTRCDTVRTGGNTQWEVEGVKTLFRRPLAAPELTLGGGVEAGSELPSVMDPALSAKRRAFGARHPDHSWEAVQRRVVETFVKLQEAWSTQEWELARPYETDALFQVHRFWMERYRRFGLRNRLDQVKVRGVQLVKVDMDAFFESFTVRVYASMLDWTEKVDPSAPRAGGPPGQVVGGSATAPRIFSEYWTFVRAVGGKHRPESEWSADACPSCGAPLDKVSMAGVCGYCDSKITGGDFDWVLSRIEQDESYGG